MSPKTVIASLKAAQLVTPAPKPSASDDGKHNGPSSNADAAPAPKPLESDGGAYTDPEALIDLMKERCSVLLDGNQVRLIIEKGNKFDIVKKSEASVWFQKFQLVKEMPRSVKYVPGLDVYLESSRRLEFHGTTNDPRTPRRSGELYTTWRGFGRSPVSGEWPLLRDHIFHVICGGDKKLFKYMMSWIAQMLQDPANKTGVAVVLRGPKGSGKTTLGFALRLIIGPAHSRKVSQPKHVTGNFNNHMRDTLLLLVEEGVWGGDKVADGVMKDLVTGDTIMLESKGVDAKEMPNYTRLVITSNEDWIIPAGKGERRWFVLDVKDKFEGLSEDDPARAAYFDPIYAEMNNGGLEAMMAELVAWDYSQVNLRQPPMTDGLRRQMAQTFTGDQQWILDALIHGGFTDRAGQRISGSAPWELGTALEISTEDLIVSYRDHVATHNNSAAATHRMIRALEAHGVVSAKRLTTRHGERPRGYVLGTLQEWRDRFTSEFKYEFGSEAEEATTEVVDLEDFRKKKAEP
jgi:hypothetical protein